MTLRPTHTKPRRPAAAQEQEPVAWLYELALGISASGIYSNWDSRLSVHKPNVPDGSIRNLTPLFTAPPIPQPAPGWDRGELLECAQWLEHGASLAVSAASKEQGELAARALREFAQGASPSDRPADVTVDELASWLKDQGNLRPYTDASALLDAFTVGRR